MLYNKEFLNEHSCIIFFFMGLSNFTLGLALHGLQCGMMVKVRDNARSTLDEYRAEGQLLKNICRKAKS